MTIFVLFGLLTLSGMGSLACYILVVIKMFQNGDTTLGILSLALLPVFAVGIIVAFVIGWIYSGKYRIKKLMLGWTGVVAMQIVFEILFIIAASAK
jgi:hypothetical protein